MSKTVQITPVASAGSGELKNDNTSSFNGARTDTSADFIDTDADTDLVTNKDGSTWVVGRQFYPFNISSIPKGVRIKSAKLVLKGGTVTAHDDGYFSLCVQESSQSSVSSLSVNDFDNLTINSPTELTTRITVADGDQELVFNKTGRDLIKSILKNETTYLKLVVRTSRDVDNSAPAGYNRKEAINSNTTYLEVTYTRSGAASMM